MKILHTADWHIGQLFYQYDRTFEHQQFLNWLVGVIEEQQIEILLISGDIFDVSNPSAPAIKMFYTFLNKAIKANPAIQIVVTAGNHDSASRLESPKPLLESTNIHIIGVVERKQDGAIDYEKLVIPLKNTKNETEIWCLAIPFLRMGDYPVLPDTPNSYSRGVEALYKEAYEYTVATKSEGQPIIAMGHLHTFNAEITDDDSLERPILGGVEFIPATAFNEELAYVALGHIHKAQKIGGRESVRYSGSPLPMSFAEIHYRHQVIIFEIAGGTLLNLQSLEVPLAVTLLRVPAKHKPLHEVLPELRALPLAGMEPGLTPYIEVRVLEDGPDPARRHKVETALAGRAARLAAINVKSPAAISEEDDSALAPNDGLNELKPDELFAKIYKTRYNSDIPEGILKLFSQVMFEANTKE